MSEQDFPPSIEPAAQADDEATTLKASAWVAAAQQPVQGRLDASPLSGFAVMGWLVGGAAFFNFIILPIVRGSEGGRGQGAIIFFVSLAVGVYAAEVGLVTLGLVWGPGTFLRRLAGHWVIVIGLYAAWAFGFAAGFGSISRSDGVPKVWGAMLCALPLITLAAQLPLWPLRVYFGWRIERTAPASLTEMAQPLLIRDFLAGMVVTGVALAALRLMPEEMGRGNGMWVGWAIAFASVGGISAFSLLPAVVFLLRNQTMVAAATAWFGYSAVMWIATLVVASSLMGSGPPDEVVVATIVVFASFAGALSVPLFIARARGYRLTFRGDRGGAIQSPTAVPPGAAGPPAA